MATAEQNQSLAHGSRVLAILVLTYVFNLLDRQIVGVLAIPIKQDLAISDTQLGFLGGFAFALFYTVLGIPIAWLADRKSRVTIIAVSLALWSAFSAACGLAQNFLQLVLLRMGVAVGEAGGVAPAHSIISDCFRPEDRGRALAVFNVGAPIGSALGIFFGGWIATTFDWRIAFMIVGVAGLALVPIVKLGIPEPRRGHLDQTTGAADVEPAGLLTTMGGITASPAFWLVSLGGGLGAIPSAGLVFWLPTFLNRSFRLDLADASLFFGSLLFLGGVSGAWLGGVFADKVRARRGPQAYALVPAIIFFLAAPAFIAAIYMPTLVAVWVLLLVWLALTASWLGPVIAAIHHIVPANMRATASASYLFINSIVGTGMGTLFFGMMSDYMTAARGDDALRVAMLYGMIFYPLATVLCGLAAWRMRKTEQAVTAARQALP